MKNIGITAAMLMALLASSAIGMEVFKQNIRSPEYKNQLVRDFEKLLQEQDWNGVLETIKLIEPIDKDLAKTLKSEYGSFRQAVQLSREEEFPHERLQTLLNGFNDALKARNSSSAKQYLDEIATLSPPLYESLKEKLASLQAQLKAPAKPAQRLAPAPAAKPIPVAVKPGSLVAIELVGCKTPFKYVVNIIKENTNVLSQRINEKKQYYQVNVPLTDAKNYWIKVSNEEGQVAQQTYPTIQEYSVENGKIYAIVIPPIAKPGEEIKPFFIKNLLNHIDLKQDKVKLVINCTKGIPEVTIQKAK
jgi:hypothetical protein